MAMWKHYCEQEKTWLSVEHGQPCNWCDAKPFLRLVEPVKPDDAKESNE